MSDLTPNKNDNNPERDSESSFNADKKYELITAYIDNEIKDGNQKEEIRKLIETDPDFYNRYIFEKHCKQTLQTRVKSIETPLYLYKNIGESIDGIIKSSSKTSQEFDPEILSREIQNEKSNLKKYLYSGSFVLVILIALSFALNYYLKKNPNSLENDLVSVSRNIFSKVEAGQITLKFNSHNAKELEDSMNKYVDFKVFIPDVKDAELIGGVCNEVNGEMLVHFVHKKGNIIIYTLQANYKHIMNNEDKVILCDEFKENVKSGKNWFPCNKDKANTAVIWIKDNVICSSVAHMESGDIYAVLTNFK